MQFFRALFLPLFCIAVPSMATFSFAKTSAAESCKNDGGPLVVDVRTIIASDPIRPGDARRSRSIDERISDLSRKLRKLQFYTFKLLDAHQQVIPLLKKETISIANGSRLTLRPTYLDKSKVGMWLGWIDREGGEILNTRIHFTCDEPMLAGTDSQGDRGLILAIKVSREATADCQP